jgi:UDP-N-acetylglucosamine--N-acetylmuramyl-(pentapeptide) pyrophosphoryl-undecaprenol N-acetylglucosamine transferase
VVFSKGGTGAFPVVLAAWFYRVPILIHESDATPGLTNLLSSRFATRIATSFELAARYFNPQKVAWTGNPIRDELIIENTNKGQAKEALGFKRDAPLLFVIGGSRGAQRMNEFIVLNLPALLGEAQILHQTGKANIAEIEKLAKTELLTAPKNMPLKKYQAVGFLEKDLALAYAAADMVITRAGAGVLFEIASCGKPALLIPIAASANNHQRANAYEFAKTGGGIVIEEINLFPGVFMNQLKNLLKSPGLLDKMGNASRTFVKPNAKRIIAEELIGLALTKGE